MKKIVTFIVCLAFIGFSAILAQDIQISGKVTNADDGNSLPGVSVVVTGTTIGTATNIDGDYSLSVPSDATLLFTSIGMKSKAVEVAGQSVINVALETEAVEVAEVVVTALGLSREKKSLGYSVQDIQSEELTEARESNVINALSGRVSGIQVTGHGGGYGGSSRILIRGANSVTGENQPLFIVDGVPFDNSNYTDEDQRRGSGGFDYGSMAQDINPDDVESISVLKGATAAALYGTRASNGVIVVTTKKGDRYAASGKKGLGISINSGVTFENVSILPKFQNEYGGGYIVEDADGGRDGFEVATVDGVEYLIPDYAVDECWGPKMEGQQVAAWHNVYDYEQGITSTLQTSPWSPQPDNIKDFFETGVTFRNNVALVGGTENTSFRLSYTNTNQALIWPNGEIIKNNLSVSGTTKLSEKLKAFSTLNFINTAAKGRPGTGYDGQNPTQSFYQWGHRQWDMEEMKNYKNPDGTMRTWNRISLTNPSPKYNDNPYWVRYMSYNEDERNRLYGNVGLSYNLTDYLTLSGKVLGDYYLDRREERIAMGSQEISKYVEGVREFMEINSEFLIQFNKQVIESLNVIASFGGNQMTHTYARNVGETAGGLSVPEFYNLGYSIASATHDDYFEKKRINSLYGFVNLNFMDMIYVDATLRNDWSSTLPEDNNSYMYPSVGTSIVFSEMGPLSDLNWLTLGKLRASIAKVGNDTDPYDLITGYRAKENFGSNPRITLPNTLLKEDLVPEMTTSWEVGADLRFLNSRIGLDITYYSNKTIDQIIRVDMSAASGFTRQVMNAGEMTNKGLEMMVDITPLKVAGFEWNIRANWARNINELVELDGVIQNYTLQKAPFSVTVNATVGESYGTIRGDNFAYHDGQKILDGGIWVPSDGIEVLGTVMADWTGGLSNTFSYKGLDLSFLIDVQKGGSLFSTSYMFGMYSGMLEETAGLNELGNPKRDDPADGGGILLEGVMDDGTGNYIPNDVRIDIGTYGSYHYVIPAANVFDADYYKLREVRLGYTLPNKFTGPVESLRIALVGRNLLTWGTAIEHIDPAHATNTSNVQGIEGAQVPPVRSVGVNVSFNF